MTTAQTTQSLDFDNLPLGEVVGPFHYDIPTDFNARRLPTVGVTDRACTIDDDGREIAEPSVLCGQHTWTLRRRFHWFGSVHAKCDIEYLQPVHVGTAIEVTSTVSEKYERRGGRYVVFLLETRRPDGVLACRVRNTMLLNFAEVNAARRATAAGTITAPVVAATAQETRETAPASIVAGPFPFERQPMIDFFGSDESVYGPHPSIHNEGDIAARIGLDDIIAPGRYGIGLMNGALLRLMGPSAFRGTRYDVSILNNLAPGMRAVATATARADEVGAFRFECRDEISGRALLSGSMQLGTGRHTAG